MLSLPSRRDVIRFIGAIAVARFVSFSARRTAAQNNGGEKESSHPPRRPSGDTALRVQKEHHEGKAFQEKAERLGLNRIYYSLRPSEPLPRNLEKVRGSENSERQDEFRRRIDLDLEGMRGRLAEAEAKSSLSPTGASVHALRMESAANDFASSLQRLTHIARGRRPLSIVNVIRSGVTAIDSATELNDLSTSLNDPSKGDLLLDAGLEALQDAAWDPMIGYRAERWGMRQLGVRGGGVAAYAAFTLTWDLLSKLELRDWAKPLFGPFSNTRAVGRFLGMAAVASYRDQHRQVQRAYNEWKQNSVLKAYRQQKLLMLERRLIDRGT